MNCALSVSSSLGGIKSVYTPTTNPSSESMATSGGPKWAQKTITLPPLKRGCHLVTAKVLTSICFTSTALKTL